MLQNIEYEIEKMNDIVDIKKIKDININYIEIILALITIFVAFFLIWYLINKFKKIFKKDNHIKNKHPEIDIYNTKKEELIKLKNLLKKQYKEKDYKNFLLTATYIIKLEKEILHKDKFLHTTTKEFKQKLQIFDDLLDKIDKQKFDKNKHVDIDFINQLYDKLIK